MKTMTKLAIGITVTAGIYTVVASEDHYANCDRTVYASDVTRWIDDNGGQVNYNNGKWYNMAGDLIGTSATEDSDVCAK